MSYQVLARKWRPQNFKQMVGQEHVLQALIHALDSQRLHHAYLFTGTRGVGKTTIGRILAKCLSCEERITSEPCGHCSACLAITEGRYVDLIEIDAASRTKVEDMRELLENVQYAPSQGRFKIYLIDEVHMLSQSSFNALLKTLEEPPSHVKFLFATTDPQKLPVTILSRCLQFNLKNMSPEKIVAHLKHVLNEEQVSFEDAALWALARAAEGSMRDALSLTDQAIAYGNHRLTEAGVSTMLGTVDQKKIYRILDALVKKDAAAMLAEVQALADFSPDYRSVLATLSSILHRIALEQVVPGSVDNAMGDREHIIHYARRLCAEDVQLFYQIALTSRQDLQITPDAKSGFEMALLRMFAFQMTPVMSDSVGTLPVHEEAPFIPETIPGDVPEYASETPEDLSSEVFVSGEGDQDVEVLPPEAYQAYATDQIHTIDEQENLGITQQEQFVSAASSPASAIEDEEKLVSETANQVLAESAESEKKKPVLNDNRINDAESWNSRVAELGLTGMTLNFMLNSVLAFETDKLYVFMESGHFRLLTDNHEKRIREALLDNYPDHQQIEFVDGLQAGQETPMMWRERFQQERKEHARALIINDPHVDFIIQSFRANLIEASIQPES
jgi:DNA polymerase-3 subunit gamma/tau